MSRARPPTLALHSTLEKAPPPPSPCPSLSLSLSLSLPPTLYPPPTYPSCACPCSHTGPAASNLAPTMPQRGRHGADTLRRNLWPDARAAPDSEAGQPPRRRHPGLDRVSRHRVPLTAARHEHRRPAAPERRLRQLSAAPRRSASRGGARASSTLHPCPRTLDPAAQPWAHRAAASEDGERTTRAAHEPEGPPAGPDAPTHNAQASAAGPALPNAGAAGGAGHAGDGVWDGLGSIRAAWSVQYRPSVHQSVAVSALACHEHLRASSLSSARVGKARDV